MVKKINKSPGRIIEAVSTEGDHAEKTDEFWGVESLRKRPIEEQYPKLENETDNHYNERLQEIQALTELAQADLSEEDKREIENGAYTEKSGKAAVPNYKKFGMSALQTFDMAEKNPDLFHSDERKYGLERQRAQEDKAEYYIKIYQRKQPELSEFSGLVPGDKLTRDQSYLREKERKIEEQNAWKNSEERTKDERMETWDRVAEAVLYPLALNFGLFDDNVAGLGGKSLGQHRARAIYPSKFDDLSHGVDAAFMIPTGVNEQGKMRYAPVTFDCTTSTNIVRVMDKFGKVRDDGRTRIDYAKTEDGDLMTNVRPLNFIIGVDHTDLISDRGLIGGDNIAHVPKAFLHDIYVQIYAQAILRSDYYQALRYNRGKPKSAKLADFLSKDELADAWQTFAVRDFFGRKCKETAINKNRPFDLSRAYSPLSSVSLVVQEIGSLLQNQRRRTETVRKQKGWQ